MKKIGLIIIFGITITVSKAQNLIPDGTLSIHNNIDCPPAFTNLQGSDYWYAVGNTTVDFYLAECEYTSGGQGFSTFWNYPYYGNGFLGFWGVFRSNFTIGSEVFGTVLTESLKANQAYYFTTDVRYRGKDHPDPDIFPLSCPSNPPLALQIYTSIDTVRAAIDHAGASTQVFANRVLTLDSPAITDTIFQDNWSNVYGCFVAEGGEKHLGFSLTIDTFTAVSPCEGPFLDPWISVSYYNIDNVELIPFPNEITDTFLLCKEEKGITIDFEEYFGTIDITKFQPVWEDGITTLTRTFEDEGEYTLALSYECNTTIFNIQIVEEKCDVNVFVPDAFTPNFDGRNDELFPFFGTDYPISNYEFLIFDRWGNIFYRSTTYDGFTGWDGSVNGKSASANVYVWSLKFTHHAPKGSKEYQLSGDVLLVR